ncbi:MAG: hypothetical protein E3J90_05205 [Promethearchaeota archaeon]|nr:MAG: hypothetical protein E3J90_05205 [Candidatus Lokiarchaeota archaeon]
MAILEQNLTTQIGELNEYSDVKIDCPICKASKVMKFPKSVINKARHLTTISLPKGLICDHHFQAFLDKNFAVRGYQKVDFEFENKKDQKKHTDIQLFSENEDELFDHLIVEGNYVGYQPDLKKNNVLKQKSQESKKPGSKRSLKDIYNEFWEFIGDNNSEFKDFISKDKRRIKLKLKID